MPPLRGCGWDTDEAWEFAGVGAEDLSVPFASDRSAFWFIGLEATIAKLQNHAVRHQEILVRIS
jgi:hypothetical protein